MILFISIILKTPPEIYSLRHNVTSHLMVLCRSFQFGQLCFADILYKRAPCMEAAAVWRVDG